MNLSEEILRAGAGLPDRLALSALSLSRADRWSHARLRRAGLGAATGLTEAGLRPGDRLLLPLAQGPYLAVAFLGAIAAGILPAALPPRPDPRDLRDAIAALEPAMILADASLPVPRQPPCRLDPRALAGFESLPAAGFADRDAEAPAYLVFSQGAPLVRRHGSAASLPQIAQNLGLSGQDRLLHVMAADEALSPELGLLAPLASGATVLIPAAGLASAQLPLLASRHGASIIAAPAAILSQMLATDWKPWASLRLALVTDEESPAPALRAAWCGRTGGELRTALRIG
ncbi:AMP-binding protein [Paracoccus sp. CPCC 101403]|uniref:AMP-binding protein n=1 Tax=Paracoccus broussonetiae TaxID=3075834 RepID=A0ABU3ECI7_9RHOB|nr:AMP-binding protein [Paracoccus sp. CPCC 101403]MDT1061943.1 AMP-binding protein [Paracoccus sp. CPCC 101403]